MPISLWSTLLFASLLFPTLSLLNINSLPIFRVDFLAQVTLAFYLIFTHRRRLPLESIIMFCFFLLLTAIFPAVINSLRSHFNLVNAIEAIGQLIIFSSIVLLIMNDKNNISWHPRLFLNSYLFVSFFVFLFGIYQFISLNFAELPYDRLYFNAPGFAGTIVESHFDGWIRAASVFKEPTHFCFFSAHVFIVLITSREEFRSQYFWYLFLFLSLFSIIIAYSLGVFFALFCLAIVHFFGGVNFKNIFISIFLLSLLYVLPSENRINDVFVQIWSFNLSDLHDGSLIVRIMKFILGLSVFLENPLFGIGPNQLGNYEIYPITNVSWSEYSTNIFFTNFHFLGIAVDSGICGLIVWGVVLFRLYLYVTEIQCPTARRRCLYLLLLNLFAIDLPLTSPYRLISLLIALGVKPKS